MATIIVVSAPTTQEEQVYNAIDANDLNRIHVVSRRGGNTTIEFVTSSWPQANVRDLPSVTILEAQAAL